MNAELLEYVSHVHLRRRLTDEEQLGNFVVRSPLSQELIDLAFAWRELFARPKLARNAEPGAPRYVGVA